MIKVAFLSDWGNTPNQLFERFRVQTPACKGVWGNIIGTGSLKEADYYIIFDSYNKLYEDKIDFNRAIMIRREPPQIISDASIEKDKYLKVLNLPCFEGTSYNPVTWWVSKTYDELKNMDYQPNLKNKSIGCISSNKWPQRSKYIKYISKNITDIEVWGRWDQKYTDYDFTQCNNFKGGVSRKEDGITQYHYSLCLENISYKNYWTEKIADSILCWSIPLYFGSPNIHDFFSEDCVKTIDLSKNSIATIKKIIQKEPSESEIEALSHARGKILDFYNLWPYIDRIIGSL